MPMVFAKARAFSKSFSREMTNLDAMKTWAVFSLSTIPSLNLTGEIQESKCSIFKPWFHPRMAIQEDVWRQWVNGVGLSAEKRHLQPHRVIGLSKATGLSEVMKGMPVLFRPESQIADSM